MKKTFDAVEFQRKIRRELSEKYSSDREAFLRELREKYHATRTEKAPPPSQRIPSPKTVHEGSSD